MRTGSKRSVRGTPIVVCVVHHPRGRWEIVAPNRRGRISCETLDDARRIAYLSIPRGRDCELIVRDAYHRVLEHELIDGRLRDPFSSRSRASKQSTNSGGQ